MQTCFFEPERIQFTPRPYQIEAVDAVFKDFQEHRCVGTVAPTGCLSGDTVINVNRGGIGRTYTLKRLYNCTNGNPDKIRYLKTFSPSIPTMVRSHTGERIRLNKALEVLYSGKKKVFLVKLEDGRSLKATGCHKIMTIDGWVPVSKLLSDSLIATDTLRAEPSGVKKKKSYDTPVQNLWYHPYAVKTKTNKESRGYTLKIEKHRAIFEAHLNGISLDVYVNILRNSPSMASKLVLVDPSIFDIHHKDFDHKNNHISNLCMMDREKHRKIHGDYGNFNQGVVNYVRLKSVEYVGVEDTYDIRCEAPHHNFVANGIVVHNSGKTEVFIMVAERFLNEYPDEGKVIVLSHRDVLTDQTRNRFKDRTGVLPGILQGEDFPGPYDRVVISTMQTARNPEKFEIWKRRVERHNSFSILTQADPVKVGLIIVDEMHYVGCESYRDILDSFPEARVFGVTATPFRDGKIMTGLMDSIAFSTSLKELISAGYLVEPKLNYMGHYDPDDLHEVVASVANIYKQCEDGNNAIVFMRKIDDCKTMATAFKNEKVEASVVSSETPKKLRGEIFEKFKTGETKVLVTVNVLTEGFDAPNTRAIFMPYPTQSPTMYMQRIGRGLRLCEGKECCNIYYGGEEAPEISKRQWEALQEKVVQSGAKEEKPRETIEEELEYLESIGEVGEKFRWTQEVADAINRLRELRLIPIADMVNQMEFPEKFMSNIDLFLSGIPKHVPQYPGKMTPKQKALLLREGFPKETLDNMGRAEASILISGIFKANGWENKEDARWKVEGGLHDGKMMWEIPYSYWDRIHALYPESDVARQHDKYIEYRRKRKEFRS